MGAAGPGELGRRQWVGLQQVGGDGPGAGLAPPTQEGGVTMAGDRDGGTPSPLAGAEAGPGGAPGVIRVQWHSGCPRPAMAAQLGLPTSGAREHSPVGLTCRVSKPSHSQASCLGQCHPVLGTTLGTRSLCLHWLEGTWNGSLASGASHDTGFCSMSLRYTGCRQGRGQGLSLWMAPGKRHRYIEK